MQKVSCEAAVDFFGEGVIFLTRAQTSFDMPNRNVVVIRGERSSEGRRRIALHKNYVWAFVLQDPVKAH